MAKSEDSSGAHRSIDGGGVVADRAGRYEYVERTSQGSFGSVWKARVTSGAEVGRVVAIRRISRGGLTEAEVERLTTAGFSAMEVRHPKIAAVLDVVVGEAEIAVVSELVEGIRLRDLLESTAGKGSNCPPEAALRMAIDLLEAVRGIKAEWDEIFPEDGSEEEQLLRRCIHGGMLPDTVLVANFGETMLTDIGLTGAAMTLPLLSERLDVMGYRAPEQLAGRTDERSDVFTVGVFLYELVTNRALFAPASLAKSSTRSDPAQLTSLRKKIEATVVPRLDSLPRWKGTAVKPLADVMARALERDPAKRFQSVDDMIGAILKLGSRLGNEQTVASFVARLEPLMQTVQTGRTSVDSVRDTIPPESTSPTIPPLNAPDASNRATLPGDLPKPPKRGAPPARPSVPPADVPPPPVSLRALVDEPITLPTVVPEGASRSDADASDVLPTEPRGFPLPEAPFLRGVPPPPEKRPPPPSVAAAENKTDLTSSESLSTFETQTKGVSPKIWIAGAAAAVALAGIGIAMTRGGGAAGPSESNAKQEVTKPSPPAAPEHRTPTPVPSVTVPPTTQAQNSDAGARAAPSAAASSASPPASAPATEQAPAEAATAAPQRRRAPAKKPFRPTGI